MIQLAMEAVIDLLGAIWILPLVLGLIGLGKAVLAWRRGARVALWPTVPGMVTRLRLRKGRAWSDMGSNTRGMRTYQPFVIYAYTVAGRNFEGTRVQFGMPRRHSDKLKAQKVLDKFAVGQKVEVHYDPERPAESALASGVAPAWKGTMRISVALVTLGALAWIASFIMR